MDQEPEPKEIKTKRLIVLLAIVFAVWLAYLLVVGFYIPSKWSDKGQFGDMFGSINALFSAFAFAGLIYAIFLQRRELHLQYEELKETRKELKGQKEQLEGQKLQMEIQNFERWFLELLSHYNRLIQQVQDRDNKVFGEAALSFYVSRIKRQYQDTVYEGQDDAGKRQYLRESLPIWFGNLAHDVTGFLRVACLLLEEVGRCPANRDRYLNTLLGLLTGYPLILLFYYCLSRLGEEYRPLIERMGVFRHIDKKQLLHESHADHYSPSAFGESTGAE